jgi:3-oxoadipate enol-lactonase
MTAVVKNSTYCIPTRDDKGFIDQFEEDSCLITEFTYLNDNDWPLYAKSVELIGALETAQSIPVVILLHGGGPDHKSLIPLAKQIAGPHTVILPDIRGYGRSVCTDPLLHTWAQYANDVISLAHKISADHVILGGAGLGSTISLRTALNYPNRVNGLVLISVEDIEDDKAKEAEIIFMEDFAKRVRDLGIAKAWEPILNDLSPVIESMVRDAIPRSNPQSIAAAAAIGYDRSFRSVKELFPISVPTLIIPGMDWRHPKALAKELSENLPNGYLANVTLSAELKNAEDFANSFAPIIRNFIDQKTLSSL